MKTPWGLARENAALKKLLADTVSKNEELVAQSARKDGAIAVLAKAVQSLEGQLQKFNRPRNASGKFTKAEK